MGQQQQFGRGVDGTALRTPGIPGVADLHPRDRRHDVVVAGRAQHLAAGGVQHREGQAMALGLALQRGFDIGAGLLRLGHAGEAQIPQLAICGGGLQPGHMVQRQRHQTDRTGRQRDRADGREFLVHGLPFNNSRRASQRPAPQPATISARPSNWLAFHSGLATKSMPNWRPSHQPASAPATKPQASASPSRSARSRSGPMLSGCSAA
mmetsp:Transcript_1095/g.2978  ORF Transcript_1095/g.2978 Transcript_1095/m.2978 type:complete len:208 (+) Transcript_1095:364-987(+)